MSSKPRIIVPDRIYQITSQCSPEIQIFAKDELRSFFIQQLATTIKKYECTCISFSITNCQYHLAIKSGEQSISKAMQRFNSVLARMFNKSTGRGGVVFKTRFKSIIVEDGNYVMDLIRFIHLEPVNKGECSISELDTYKWSSHSLIINKTPCSFQTPMDILKYFNGSDDEYRNFMFKGLNVQNEEVIGNIKNANLGKRGFQKPELWIIGNPEFIQDTLTKDKCRRARLARHKIENVTFESIHKAVEDILYLDTDTIFRQGYFDVNSTARELFVFVSKYRYDFSGAQIAKYLKISESAVSRMITRFNKLNNNDFLLKGIGSAII